MTTFEDYKLGSEILTALARMGFKEPTPVQSQALPLVLGGHDLIATAETGSGKTAACAIPICDRVDTSRKEIQALIVVPTRELALQYATETQTIGKEKGVKAYALFGGEDLGLQRAKMAAGVHVMVATPGRLIDLVYQRLIDLTHVETLILDEADEMLSMGFYEDLEFIIQCLVHDHQTLLFSATMPKEITSIAKQHMKSPKEVKLIAKKAAPKNLEHKFVYCRNAGGRPKVVLDLIKKNSPKQSLIFCQSRRQVEDLCRDLKSHLPGVDFLHGGLSQNLRTTITNKFRSQKLRHLVVTDVAARGLDFSHVTHVFIYQLGRDIDTYVHRSGRTGRSGRKGVCISLVTNRELSLVPRIEKKIGKEIEWMGPKPSRRPPPRG